MDFKKLTTSSSRKMSREMMDMLSSVPGLLGEYILDGKKNTKQKNTNVPRNMAQQVGIEKSGPGWQEEDLDLLKLLASIRSRLGREKLDEEEAAVGKMLSLLSQIEENMAAQQLINRARTQDNPSYYYLQVPMRLDDRELTAEIKIYYTTDYDGSKKVDEDNATMEFSVTAEHLGALYFHIEIIHGIIHVETGVGREDVRAFVDRHMPALMENLRKHSYAPGSSKCYLREEWEEPSLPVCMQDFEKLERVNLSY